MLGLAVAQQRAAAAPPPPPSFWEFTITNSLDVDVADLTVELTLATPPKYDSFGATPITLTVPTVPTGGQVVLGLKQIYGVARIKATASCPVGGPPVLVKIEAPKADYSVPPDGQQEYPGFCKTAPPGQTDYLPQLEFRRIGGVNSAKLHAKWRWEDHWPPNPVVDTKPFP